jgi:YD repeat-containing protein
MPRLIVLLIILVCQGALRAQDTESDNPTGLSGEFNGEVTTAGSYDPFTGNIKRQVTDLTVPGANGSYALAFARTFNSHKYTVGTEYPFGDSAAWRHSYQWTLSISTVNGTAYTVVYPDGAAITFRAGRASAPSQEKSTFWRGPSGTADRLEVQDSSHIYLHTADGGVVNFGNATHPSSIVDPYGAITALTYMSNNPNYLAQVTEPGGRWLKLSYVTATYKGKDLNGNSFTHTWTLLTQVTASNGQTVTYTETQAGSQSSVAQIYPYYVLTGVSYDQETSTSGGNVHASYGYNVDAGGSPILVTATDPHYAGAMVNIRYAYGASIQEQNLSTSELVSGCVITYPSSGITTSTETRGDKSSGTGNTSGAGANLTRTFNFGTTNPAIAGSSAPKPSLLSSVSDFEARTSYKYYYSGASKDINGTSFLMATVDANNNAIYYQHDPLTGRVTQVKFADGRTRTASWRAKDDTTTFLPYFLYQTTDERGLTTTWHHYAGTGQVSQIDYPDGSHEYFQYAAFSGNGGTFYKLSCFTNKLGGQIIYGYDEAGHGGSGHSGLLTSVTRSYQVGSSTTPVHETTAFTYDSFDRVVQSTDPRGIADSYSYNSRHQVVKVTHVNDGSSIAIGYDDYGNCISVQDENGNTKTAAYDEYRRLVSVSTPVNAPNAAGSQIASRYEAFSYLRYDNANNIWGDALSNTNSNWGAKWLPSGSAVQRVFSPNGLCTDEDDGMYVNGSGNPIRPVVAYGFAHIGKAYNAVGQLGTETDPLGFTTTFAYDAYNRLISSTDTVGHIISRAYYGNGEHSTG